MDKIPKHFGNTHTGEGDHEDMCPRGPNPKDERFDHVYKDNWKGPGSLKCELEKPWKGETWNQKEDHTKIVENDI